ncbi:MULTISPECIES: hypothetical protein [Lachnospiraceae]|uniref:hypothetical protein n=1 Tax=Lachnospiraceae TaxID=186803 RepID=UPI000951820E|nr:MULTISPECIES: hypothetical protein [Lachnospiraceae]WVK68744.1 hypothetical protein BIV20_10155 [Roseburia sp. 499]
MGKDINAIFDTGSFNRIVMGVVTVALRESGCGVHKKAEVLYECQQALDNMTAAEFEEAYHEYLVSGK